MTIAQRWFFFFIQLCHNISVGAAIKCKMLNAKCKIIDKTARYRRGDPMWSPIHITYNIGTPHRAYPTCFDSFTMNDE